MKKPMTITLAVLLAAISAALCSPLTGAETAGVQSLRTEAVAAPDQAPEEKAQLGDMPGAQKPIARTFQQQPPLIPHATANFDEITLKENPCLLCHETNAPKAGVSHFKDIKGKLQKTVSSVTLQYKYEWTPNPGPEWWNDALYRLYFDVTKIP